MRYRFVDCRWSLDDPELGRRAYLEGHIPGAVFLDVERDLSAPPGAGGRHPLPEPRPSSRRRPGARASTPATFVVAYGSLGGAERLWWLLRHFGHDDCAVLDLDGVARAAAQPARRPSSRRRSQPRERTDDTIDRDELAERLDELVVVDARVPARWRGEANPVDRVPGRIPGALNAPWNEPLPALPDGELVAYCGSGVTACVVAAPPAPRRPRRAASTRARGRSGSSTRSCRSSAGLGQA